MANIIFPEVRKSFMALDEIYFWTATINSWKYLLKEDAYKDIIIQSMEYLSNAEVMDVYGFVIMPNHMHTIWRSKKLNGKESGQGSFLKHTAHEFKKKLRREERSDLANYRVRAINKNYEFWQRDPVAIRLYTKKVAFQKLDYIHRNPLQPHWQLVNDPCDYFYSSARFYETGKNDFKFLKDLREVM